MLSAVKVAMVTDCYVPRLGGIETQVRDLSRQLRAAGHDVEVFTATTGAQGERGGTTETGDDGIPVHRLALPLPFGLPVNPFAPGEVRRRLRDGRFDVVHAHLGVVSPFATDSVPVALDLRLPVAATFHCVVDRSGPVFRMLGHLARWAARGVALNAVSSMAAARVSAVAGDVPVEVVPNGIEASWWLAGGSQDPPGPATHEPNPVTGPSRRPVHVVSAMRFVSRKRPIAALGVLRGARAIVDRSVPMRATLVGEGPQRRLMERYLRTRGMDWVGLPGRVDREDLRRLHHTADVYLSTARLEAFGIAALEARAAGVPVVATRGTGADDFLTDGVDGLLGDSDVMLAGALAHLVGDDALRASMRAHVRSTPPQQDWPGVVGQTVAEYHRAGVPAR
ncbi:MAG TPA: glycosyltransferase family 4 protein [Ornithinibacter sp.]|jgi:glycosyltransferase involved in cell wall biosynthesis|nr:glycosyltransferase family 4 protein [Ornithinibacter sp.]